MLEEKLKIGKKKKTIKENNIIDAGEVLGLLIVNGLEAQ